MRIGSTALSLKDPVRLRPTTTLVGTCRLQRLWLPWGGKDAPFNTYVVFSSVLRPPSSVLPRPAARSPLGSLLDLFFDINPMGDSTSPSDGPAEPRRKSKKPKCRSLYPFFPHTSSTCSSYATPLTSCIHIIASLIRKEFS
ncbi:hypothetical protein B296_00034221 [Ensete ventricosum]|uniref:Uncharacterized protein n=1 Tax=Ensete ventricosum TaxID=4639 RepID=A0A427A926_ENSVE|nr:hypothetical protein B296_00034221 [Ensete ventricosum]